MFDPVSPTPRRNCAIASGSGLGHHSAIKCRITMWVMPALPDAPQILRIEFEFQPTPAKVAKVRQHWQYTGGPPTNADCTAIGNEAMSEFVTAGGPALMRAAWTLEQVVTTDLTGPTMGVGTSTHAAIPGTRDSGSGHTLPDDVATLINYSVGRRYRGGHPREYWPFGEAEDLLDQRTWSGAFVAAVDTFINTYLTAFAAFTTGSTSLIAQVLLSYYEGFKVVDGSTGRARNVPLVRAAPLINALSGHGANSGIASQRRRRGRI